MVPMIEELEARQMMALPQFGGWWQGTFWHATDSGTFEMNLRQKKRVVTGQIVDDDGNRIKLSGKILANNQLRLNMGTKRVSGVMLARVRLFTLSGSYWGSDGTRGSFTANYDFVSSHL